MRSTSFTPGLCLIAAITSSAPAESVPIVNPGFEMVSRPLAGGEQTNGIGGSDVLVGTQFPFPFGGGVVDWSDPVTVPGWRTYTTPFGSPAQLLAGVLRPTSISGQPFVTGIEGDHVLAIQAATVGQKTVEVLQPNTTYTLSFMGAHSHFDFSYFFAVSLTAIDGTATLPIENQDGVTRLVLGSFFPREPEPDGVMRRYSFAYTTPDVLPSELVGAHVGINIFGSDGIPRVLYDDFTLTAVPVSDACPEDLDDSGAVDFSDLLTILADWGSPGATDLDGSGTTDFGDVLAILAAYGEC